MTNLKTLNGEKQLSCTDLCSFSSLSLAFAASSSPLSGEGVRSGVGGLLGRGTNSNSSISPLASSSYSLLISEGGGIHVLGSSISSSLYGSSHSPSRSASCFISPPSTSTSCCGLSFWVSPRDAFVSPSEEEAKICDNIYKKVNVKYVVSYSIKFCGDFDIDSSYPLRICIYFYAVLFISCYIFFPWFLFLLLISIYHYTGTKHFLKLQKIYLNWWQSFSSKIYSIYCEIK